MQSLTAFTLLLLTAAPLASAQWSPTKTYADPAHGVTFQYPADWKRAPNPANVMGPNLPRADDISTIVLFASPSPRFYKHIPTAFYFTYALAPATDTASCTAIANPDLGSGDDKPTRATIRGLQFVVWDSYDASASHSSRGSIYSTFLSGTCFLFETTIAESDPGLIDGERPATRREAASMNAHMLGIMQSVRIDKQAAQRKDMHQRDLAKSTTTSRRRPRRLPGI